MNLAPDKFADRMNNLAGKVRATTSRIETEETRCAAAVAKIQNESAKRIAGIEAAAVEGIRALRDECGLNAKTIMAMTGVPETRIKRALANTTGPSSTAAGPVTLPETDETPDPTGTTYETTPWSSHE